MRPLSFVWGVAIFCAVLPQIVLAEVGEEVEVTSGAITALTCAMEAKQKGSLEPLSQCPMSETLSGFAIYDVAMKEIYVLSPAKVARYELERAFGGGRIDLVGTVAKDADGVPVLDVSEYSISARPKPGAFKGCL